MGHGRSCVLLTVNSLAGSSVSSTRSVVGAGLWSASHGPTSCSRPLGSPEAARCRKDDTPNAEVSSLVVRFNLSSVAFRRGQASKVVGEAPRRCTKVKEGAGEVGLAGSISLLRLASYEVGFALNALEAAIALTVVLSGSAVRLSLSLGFGPATASVLMAGSSAPTTSTRPSLSAQVRPARLVLC